MNSRSEAAKIVVCAGSVLFILLPTVKANAAIDDESRLLKLATMKFGCLRYAEEQMFRKVVKGELADCSDDVEENNDPNNAAQWDKETRTIRAQCVEWLCTNREASEMVTHKGIWVKGARIEGGLNLSFIRIAFPLRFTNSAFQEGISLLYAEISILDLEGTYTGPIKANGLKVNRAVLLCNGFKAKGRVALAGATITGDLDCSNSQFINKNACALYAYGLEVGGSIFLRNGFRAEGEVVLGSVKIKGDLICEDGQFINKESVALRADQIKVEGSAFFRNDFKAEGEVRLIAGTINANLDCSTGQFINEGSVAIRADQLKVEGSVLLENGFKAEGRVTLAGVTITGDLDCSNGQFINKDAFALYAYGLEVGGSVFLRNSFRAEGEVSLGGVIINGDLICEKGQFINKEAVALRADQLEVGGSVFLRDGFKAEGEVRLIGGTINANLDCTNGQFVCIGETALDADGLQVKGDIFLSEGFKAEGEVSLYGTTIGMDIDCSKGKFINPNGYALDARTIKVTGDVNLRNDFRAEGEVCLKNAKIGCGLHCEKSVFFNPGKAALQADGMNVTGSVFLRNGFRAEGSVDLTAAIVGLYLILEDVNSPEKMSLGLWSARVGTLQDKSWPSKGNLYLHGLVYDTIHDDAPRDAKSRIDWLRRQPIFRPQPYEQLAAVLRKGGQDEDAREVLIAKNDDRAHLTKLTTLSEKFWYRIFGPMIGYGYHPLNTLWGVVVFVVLGCFLFAIGYMGGLITPEKESACSETTSSSTDNAFLQRRLSAFYPRFNFLVYSIDAFVPLIDLHQAKYWLPNASRGPKLLSNKVFTLRVGGLMRLYLWIHITMGWFLTTLFVVGMTGVIRT